MDLLNVLDDKRIFRAADKISSYYDFPHKLRDYTKRTLQNNPRVIMENRETGQTLRELDPKYESFINDLLFNCERAFPVEKNTSILRDSLMATDFSGLTSIMGMYWNPPGMFPSNNHALTRGKPLSHEESALLHDLCREMFSGFSSCAVPIRRDSSCGIIFHDPNTLLKRQGLVNFFTHADEIREAAIANDINGLIDLGIVNWFMMGERLQPDRCEHHFKGKIPIIKPRKRTVNYGDKVIEPDRTVPGYAESRQCARRRVIYGGFGPLNHPFGVLAAPIIQYALTGPHSLAPVIHHTIDWADKIADFPYVVGMDFSQFDMTIDFDTIQIIFEEFDAALPERYAFSRFLIPNAPAISPDPKVVAYADRSEHPPTLFASRDPFAYRADDRNYSAGNMSGQFLVATVAKLAALLQTAVILKKMKMFKTVGDDLFANDQFRIMNMGDDTIVAFKDESRAIEFTEIISGGRVENDHMFDIRPELPVVFMGKALAEVNGKRMFLPNLSSFIVNRFRSEQPYYKKTCPRLGYFESKVFYGAHPRFRELDKIMNMTFKAHFGVTFDVFVGEPEEFDQSLVNNPYNLIFLETQGHGIHYKIPIELVDPAVYNSFYLTVVSGIVNDIFGFPHDVSGRGLKFSRVSKCPDFASVA